MNSFQDYAKRTAGAAGFCVEMRGNWVHLTKGDLSETCMSTDGVDALISRDAHGVTLAHNPDRPWFPQEAL